MDDKAALRGGDGLVRGGVIETGAPEEGAETGAETEEEIGAATGADMGADIGPETDEATGAIGK